MKIHKNIESKMKWIILLVNSKFMMKKKQQVVKWLILKDQKTHQQHFYDLIRITLIKLEVSIPNLLKISYSL